MIRRQALAYATVAIISALLTTVIQPWKQVEGLASAETGVLAQAGRCLVFKETTKQICGRFLEYWQQNGGLPQQGYPISNEFLEKSDLDGKDYRVQYFERAVFELHPEQKPPYDVLLSQLGTFRFRQKYNGVEPGAAIPTPKPDVRIYSLRERIELTPGVGITFTSAEFVQYVYEKPGMDWKATIKNDTDQSFFYSVAKGSVLLKDSTGRSSDPGDSAPAEVRIPARGSQEVIFSIRNYKPAVPTLDYVELTIQSISSVGPIVVRYKP